jgi:hypothetical protein
VRRVPDFDELVGGSLPPDERERLQRIHDLLVLTGPPPQLSPRTEAGPTLLMRLGRSRRQLRRGVALLAAAVAALLLAFLGGFIAGHRGGNERAAGQLIRLAGTHEAPTALASLRIAPSGSAGNWPMQLSARGLPQLPQGGLYEVYLVRKGRLYASCGSFLITSPARAVSVSLNAPYRPRRGDTWVVTREHVQRDGQDASTIVLRPTT